MIRAPKHPLANARYRAEIIKAAQNDRTLQQELWIQCKRDPVFWCDTFLFTYAVKDWPDAPNRPFVLWECQEKALFKILDAFGKYDVLVEKSRDMGASWLCITSLVWRWMFMESQSFLMGSRKEELVDKAGDPKTLFYKIDYLLERMPGWLRPNVNRTSMHIENLDNKSSIDGESTNANFSVGDRRVAILMDEFAKVYEKGHHVLTGTQQVTNCRLFNSTPEGASGAYFDQLTLMRRDFPQNIIRLHWTEHPDRRKGLYTTDTGKAGGRLVILDTEYKFPPDYKFELNPTRGKFPRSPWYDKECRRATSAQIIAQELDIDYSGSDWRYFDEEFVSKVEVAHCREPLVRGELEYDEFGERPQFVESATGRLLLWIQPDVNGQIPDKLEFVVGCDISAGTDGEYSSRSAACVGQQATGEKVARFAVRNMTPEQFCDYSLAICNWFNGAFLIFEKNGGVGAQYLSRLKLSSYRNLFYRESEVSLSVKKSKEAGWVSSRETKRILLSQYARALGEEAYINRDKEAVGELREYVNKADGSIEHCRATATTDPTSAGENHGDIVIADALVVRGLKDRIVEVAKPEIDHAPVNSYLGRRAAYERSMVKVGSY